MKRKKELGIVGIVLLIGIFVISIGAVFFNYKIEQNKGFQEDILNLKPASAGFKKYKDSVAIPDSFLSNLNVRNTIKYNEYGVVFFKETSVYRGRSSSYLVLNYFIPKDLTYDPQFKKKFQENLFAMRNELNKSSIDFNKISQLQEDFDNAVKSSNSTIPLTSITQPHMLKFYTFE